MRNTCIRSHLRSAGHDSRMRGTHRERGAHCSHVGFARTRVNLQALYSLLPSTRPRKRKPVRNCSTPRLHVEDEPTSAAAECIQNTVPLSMINFSDRFYHESVNKVIYRASHLRRSFSCFANDKINLKLENMERDIFFCFIYASIDSRKALFIFKVIIDIFSSEHFRWKHQLQMN